MPSTIANPAKAAASTVDKFIHNILPFNCEIRINKKPLFYYDTVILEQGVNDIPSFAVTISYEDLNDVKLEGVDDVNAIIGNPITLQFYQGFTLEDKSNDLLGIITDIEITQERLHRAVLTIKGQAKCCLLQQGGKQNRIYQEKSLAYIVSDIAKTFSGELNIQAAPKTTHTHALVSQYQQSDFDFLNWLSFLCGEWFYWDKDCLRIGRPDNSEIPITLNFNDNLIEQRFINSLQATAHQTLHSYFPAEHRIENLKNWPKPNADSYGSYAEHHINAANKWLSRADNKQMVPINALFQDDLKQYQHTLQNIAAHNAYNLQGKSTECLLRPGVSIALNTQVLNTNGDVEQRTTGQYIVQSVKHTYNNHNKTYSNEFTAIPDTPAAFPHNIQNIPIPQSYNQLGEVISNPDQYGRVQVRMQWCSDDLYSPYLYAVQPELGTGNKGKKRGFYFLPRKGDTVVVDALHGNPNFLYISGAISHGKNMDAENNANNNIRWISTDSGHTLVFNDNEGEQGITIYDKNNNCIHINTSSNSIHISALENVTINAKNIALNATENISSSAGMNINQNAGMNLNETAGAMLTQNAGTDYTLMAANVQQTATQNFKKRSKSYFKTAEEIRVNSTKKNLQLHSAKTVKTHSGEKSKLS